MKQRILMMVMAALCAVSMGCATCDDPRQGGLFGYNPDVYKQRIAEREARLQALKEANAAEKERTRALQQAVQSQQNQQEYYRHKVDALDQGIVQLEQTLQARRSQTAGQKEAYARVAASLEEVKAKRQEVEQSAPNTEAKQRQIDELNAQIDRLLLEAEALSTM